MNIKTGSGGAGPALAVSVALERDGRFLLVLRGNPPAQHMYAFPGGRVEPDETPQDAAMRGVGGGDRAQGHQSAALRNV